MRLILCVPLLALAGLASGGFFNGGQGGFFDPYIGQGRGYLAGRSGSYRGRGHGYFSGGPGPYIGQGDRYLAGGSGSYRGRGRAGGYNNGYNKYGLYFSFLDHYLAGKQFTWQAANFQCAIRNMRLVSLDDPYKNEYVSRKIARYNVKYIWTSGFRNGRKFVWANGRPVKYGYTNWSYTGRLGLPQPDNYQGNEYCLAVLNYYYNDGILWHDVACHHKKSFVCEPSYH